MTHNDLEKYVQYGVTGTPQIKADEKRIWLGEFRERVVFALTYDQIYKEEAIKVVKEKCKDERVKKIIIENNIRSEIAEKFMDISKEFQKDYKTIDMGDKKGDIALVLASDDAVEENNIILEKIPSLPQEFLNIKNKKICKKHIEFLQKEAPFFVDEFKEINFLDQFVGIKCEVCERTKKGFEK
ncbi:DUF1694 domain-containing protein [Anaerophilus nitritogenes]|uniref:DUF1694 domain-containing protein n=1 Tax=Anaerophilus nitritogenes TaxID=2498136 RepID=UPI00101E102B|nr:DUF1694 domain-containing protein [Anaerophilus nitritogenes]